MSASYSFTADSVSGVSSVNGQTGDVDLDAADVGADPAGTATTAVAAHNADTTAVHGIADTAALETSSGATAKVTAHTAATDPHGDRAYTDTVAAGKANTVHTHAGADITSGTVAYARLPVGTTANTIAAGNDARLSDARTPTAHAASHATAGSDPVTPAAIGAAGRPRIAEARITTGDITLPATGGAWQILNQTGGAPFQIQIAAAAGDYVDISVHGMRGHTTAGFLDLAVVVAGTITRYLTTGTSTPPTEGDPGLYPAAAFHTLPGPRGLVVQPGDLSGGTLTIALAVNATGVGLLYASATYPWYWRLLNYGPPAA